MRNVEFRPGCFSLGSSVVCVVCSYTTTTAVNESTATTTTTTTTTAVRWGRGELVRESRQIGKMVAVLSRISYP